MKASDLFAKALEEHAGDNMQGPVDFSMTRVTPFEITRPLSARA